MVWFYSYTELLRGPHEARTKIGMGNEKPVSVPHTQERERKEGNPHSSTGPVRDRFAAGLVLHPSFCRCQNTGARCSKKYPFTWIRTLRVPAAFPCSRHGVWGLCLSGDPLLWAGLYPPIFLPGFIFPRFQLYDINNNLHILEGGGWEQQLMNFRGRSLCVCVRVSLDNVHTHTHI